LTREKSGAGSYACCCTSSRTTSLPTKATRILLSAWIGPPGDVGVWRATVAMIFEYSNEYLPNSTRIVSCPPEVLELYRSRRPSKTDNTPLLFSSPQNFCLPYMSVKPGRSQRRCKHKKRPQAVSVRGRTALANRANCNTTCVNIQIEIPIFFASFGITSFIEIFDSRSPSAAATQA
jgi:hypothetical protein